MSGTGEAVTPFVLRKSETGACRKRDLVIYTWKLAVEYNSIQHYVCALAENNILRRTQTCWTRNEDDAPPSTTVK